MSAWWTGLSPRERWLVGLGASILALFILFQFMWVPMTESRARAEQDRTVQLNEARLIAQNAGAVQSAGSAEKAAFSRDTLIRSARQYDLAISRVAPNGQNGLTVWFDRASGPAVLTWLDTVQAGYVMNVDRAQMVREDDGTVSAQFTVSWP